MLTFLVILKWALIVLGVLAGLLGIVLFFDEGSFLGILLILCSIPSFYIIGSKIVGKFKSVDSKPVTMIVNETQISDKTVLDKSQKEDFSLVSKLASNKMSIEQLLVYTYEPSQFIIAPMSYDTRKFEEANSHDSAMLGFKSVDNSQERLAILEQCITSFENYIDSMVGISILDRSKISQIEKEHKFQLGDWSNEKKTAEVGKALNANVLLILDKFSFANDEYHFEAKFVDINTMQSITVHPVYDKKGRVSEEVLSHINFKSFTRISTKKDPFTDELNLKSIESFRTIQNPEVKIGKMITYDLLSRQQTNRYATISPFGNVSRLDLSEFDGYQPKSKLLETKDFNFDGFGNYTLTFNGTIESGTYSFEPCEMYLAVKDSEYYTDGKIGTLTLNTEGRYEKVDVYSISDKEYYFNLKSIKSDKALVNYYVQLIKQ